MSAQPRSKSEAQLDIKYAKCWNSFCETFYGRLDFVFGAITLLGGSSVVFTVTANNTAGSVWSGAVVAVSAILERLINAPEKKFGHQAMKKRFAALDARSSSMTLEQIDTELLPMQVEGPTGIKGLAIPAFNENLRSNGMGEHALPLSLWNKFLCVVV